MAEEDLRCPVCGEPARLHCAGCDRAFCVDHLERHFAMGYYYFCAECLARQAALETAARKAKRQKP